MISGTELERFILLRVQLLSTLLLLPFPLVSWKNEASSFLASALLGRGGKQSFTAITPPVAYCIVYAIGKLISWGGSTQVNVENGLRANERRPDSSPKDFSLLEYICSCSGFAVQLGWLKLLAPQ